MVAGTFATSMDVISVVLLVLSLMPAELARIHRVRASLSFCNHWTHSHSRRTNGGIASPSRRTQELDDVLGGDREGDRPVEAADLDHLGALERFIKEALRYYPPFPVLGRACTKDLKLPSGHTLPAGCYVAFSCLATHWNPE